MHDRYGKLGWIPEALKRGIQLGGFLVLSACSPAAPAIPIFGSYFPAWIIAAVIGIITTIVIRLILVAAGIDEHLPAPLLVYICLAMLCGIGTWFVLFGGVPG
ncbi:YtcA family lipoprotein [Mesorhizobium sp. NPDC059025]|uniref:YtcA family lipoprotein n=1 Tax=unclassified Mesorhizobium TaxID=325217 RepID=UPI0036705710